MAGVDRELTARTRRHASGPSEDPTGRERMAELRAWLAPADPSDVRPERAPRRSARALSVVGSLGEQEVQAITGYDLPGSSGRVPCPCRSRSLGRLAAEDYLAWHTVCFLERVEALHDFLDGVHVLVVEDTADSGPAPQKLDHLAVEELTESAVLYPRGGPA